MQLEIIEMNKYLPDTFDEASPDHLYLPKKYFQYDYKNHSNHHDKNQMLYD